MITIVLHLVHACTTLEFCSTEDSFSALLWKSDNPPNQPPPTPATPLGGNGFPWSWKKIAHFFLVSAQKSSAPNNEEMTSAENWSLFHVTQESSVLHRHVSDFLLDLLGANLAKLA